MPVFPLRKMGSPFSRESKVASFRTPGIKWGLLYFIPILTVKKKIYLVYLFSRVIGYKIK